MEDWFMTTEKKSLIDIYFRPFTLLSFSSCVYFYWTYPSELGAENAEDDIHVKTEKCVFILMMSSELYTTSMNVDQRTDLIRVRLYILSS